MNSHFYSAPLQPATGRVVFDDEGHWFNGWPGNRLLWCGCCRKRRLAKNCVVQSYYDGLYIWCAPEKGCNSEREIKAKRNKEFRNRSRAQRARRRKEKQ